MYRLLQASALEAFDFPLVSNENILCQSRNMICHFFGVLRIVSHTGKHFLTLTPILQKPAFVVSKMDLPRRRNPWLINEKHDQQLNFVLSASVPLWCPCLHRALCQAGSSSDWPCRPRWNQSTFKINLSIFGIIHHESLYIYTLSHWPPFSQG